MFLPGLLLARVHSAAAAEKVAPHTYVLYGPNEMKPRLVATLKDYRQWSGFNDEFGRHINLVMLGHERAQL